MIRDLKPYPAYKDSGVPWLGKVPVHWELRSLGSLISAISQRGQPDLPLLSVVREKGVIPRTSMSEDENHNFVPDDLSNYKVVRKGNLVINKMKAWQGSLGIAPMDGIVSPAYFVFDFRIGDQRFGQALLRSKTYVAFFAQESDGVRIGQWDLSIHGMKRIPVVVPPLPEQTAIVRFLNWAERRIRRLIRARRRRIKLLEEYKQALIHQVVTGQIDVRTGQPYPAYKPSGVEWLGEVPAHWETCRLKSRLVKNDSGIWRDHHDPVGTIILRSTEQTVSGGWKIENPARLHLSHVEREAYLLQVGDLVVTKSSGSPDHIGKTSLVTEDVAALGCAFSNFMQRLRLGENTDPKLVWYYLNSPIGREQLVFQSTTTTGLGNLNGKILGNCVIALPPLPEQTAIVEHLDAQTAKIDTAIAAARREIELLCEYRTRLIADVVTGKVDVREVAAQLPDEQPEEEAELMHTDEIAEGEATDDETAAEALSEEEVEP